MNGLPSSSCQSFPLSHALSLCHEIIWQPRHGSCTKTGALTRLFLREHGTRAWTKCAFLGLYGRVTKAAGICSGPQHLKSLCCCLRSCENLPSLNVLAFRPTIP